MINSNFTVWTPEQEKQLGHLVEGNCGQSWTDISKKINRDFPDSEKTGRQCRQRYINYTKFHQKTAESVPWTEEEIQKSAILIEKHGTRWSHIARELSGRSENSIKNKFNCELHKLVTKINKVTKEDCSKLYKDINFQSLLRILSFPHEEETEEDDRNNIIILKKSIIKQALRSSTDLQKNDIMEISRRAHEFNCRYKCYLLRTGRKNISAEKMKKLMKKPSVAVKSDNKKLKVRDRDQVESKISFIIKSGRFQQNWPDDLQLMNAEIEQNMMAQLSKSCCHKNSQKISYSNFEEEACRILDISYEPFKLPDPN